MVFVMPGGKRPRSDNFHDDERMCLIELIKNHSDIITDKKSNSKANIKKAEVWRTISAEMFAAFPERQARSDKDYRELWRRLKNKAKSLARSSNTDQKKTGGGEKEATELDTETLAILDIIAGELQQVHNPFDDDSNQSNVDGPNGGNSSHPVETADSNDRPTDHADLQNPPLSHDHDQTSTVASTSGRSGGSLGALLSDDEQEEPVPPTSNTANSLAVKATSTKRRSSSPVLKKTDEALSYLKIEHTSKLELLSVQTSAAKMTRHAAEMKIRAAEMKIRAAEMKRMAYEEKMKYYQEKRRKLTMDL